MISQSFSVSAPSSSSSGAGKRSPPLIRTSNKGECFPSSKANTYSQNFSFNSGAGRCERCWGNGQLFNLSLELLNPGLSVFFIILCHNDSVFPRSPLQHRRHRVARFAFTRLIEGKDAIFPFLAVLLIVERGFGINSNTGQRPGSALDQFAPLNFIGS